MKALVASVDDVFFLRFMFRLKSIARLAFGWARPALAGVYCSFPAERLATHQQPSCVTFNKMNFARFNASENRAGIGPS